MDCLIKDALVVDGTGAPPRVADIGVVDGRIAAVGPGLGMAARQVVDARGLIATPGLIDIHTHSDMSLLLDGRAQSKVSQGVTTPRDGGWR
jgi:N-acyl-D-amino-acid deacylase